MDEIKLKESDVTKQILDMLNYIPRVYAYKHWGGPMGTKGVHDIICCFRGVFLSIEVKNPARKLEYSKDQADFARKVEEANGRVLLVNSVDQVAQELNLDIKLFPIFKRE